MSDMPKLPVESMVSDLSESDANIVRAAFTSRGVKEAGWARLRSNKPFKTVESFEQGCANYVWRMLCFDLVGWGKHVCMPVCADFDVSWGLDARDGKSGDWQARSELRRKVCKELDELVKRAEAILPPESRRGIMRWGRALGMVG